MIRINTLGRTATAAIFETTRECLKTYYFTYKIYINMSPSWHPPRDTHGEKMRNFISTTHTSQHYSLSCDHNSSKNNKSVVVVVVVIVAVVDLVMVIVIMIMIDDITSFLVANIQISSPFSSVQIKNQNKQNVSLRMAFFWS